MQHVRDIVLARHSPSVVRVAGHKKRMSARITQSVGRASHDCVRPLPIAKYRVNLVIGNSDRDERVLNRRRRPAEGEGLGRHRSAVIVGARTGLSAKCKEPIGVVTRRHFSPNYPSGPDAHALAIRRSASAAAN